MPAKKPVRIRPISAPFRHREGPEFPPRLKRSLGRLLQANQTDLAFAMTMGFLPQVTERAACHEVRPKARNDGGLE